jgi:hypothetical protein
VIRRQAEDGGGFTHGESEEEAGLADGGVADEEQLEEVVAASTRPVISPSDTIGNIENINGKRKDRRPAAGVGGGGTYYSALLMASAGSRSIWRRRRSTGD